MRSSARIRLLAAALWLASALLLPAPGPAAGQSDRAAATPSDSLRTVRWRQDLAYLAAELPRRHPDFFAHLAPARFAAAVAGLERRIPALADHEVAVELARLAALAGDAHTAVALPPGMPVAPIHFQWFDDGIRAYATGPLWAAFVGARLVRVGNVPVDSAMERIRAVIAQENEWWFRDRSMGLLRVAPVLHALGLAATVDSLRYTLEGPGGEHLEVALEALPPAQDVTWLVGGPPEGPRRPLYRQHGELPYWYTVIEGQRTLYFQYNVCREDPEVPMEDFAAALFEAAEHAGAERLVLDLRLNPGGDSRVLQPFLDRLEGHRLGERGRLAVLVGRRTASSAVLNALTLRGVARPVFYGEPTGGAPNHFGEVRSFELPNSGIVVRHSTKFFRQAPEITTPYLAPDIAVPITWADFAAGRDPVLERALRGG